MTSTEVLKTAGFYISIGSNDSTETFSSNKQNDFTIQLPRNIALNGHWICGLASSHVKLNRSINKPITLFCDIIDPRPANGDELMVLREIFLKSTVNFAEYNPVQYISVSTNSLFNIRIRIDIENAFVEHSSFVLHFLQL